MIDKFNEIGKRLGCNFFQIFLQSPKAFNIVRRDVKHLREVANNNIKNNIGVVVHGSYLINLCRGEGHQLNSAIRVLKYDLNTSVELGAIGVVIHMGKNAKGMHITNAQAIKNYVNNIKKILKDTDKKSTLILETGAGAGNEVGTRLETFGSIRKRLTPSEQKRVKYCIDTCHVYSAGYDIGTGKGAREFIQLVDRHVGWNNVSVIHLNSSKIPLGGKVDRHADIGGGEIDIEGLEVLIKFFKKRDLPMVLETPCDDYSIEEQIRVVRKLAKS
jgi:deoxyribonuclease-4